MVSGGALTAGRASSTRLPARFCPGHGVSKASSPPDATPTRAIILLALAAFASQAMVRVTDSLLPQIATDFSTTVGAASIVVAGYSIAHGTVQLIIGPIGDRFGKYRTITVACVLSAVLVFVCGLAQSLTELGIARLASGFAAGLIIPLSLAYIGDVTPYEQRQTVIGQYLTGQITGQLFGQAIGGILGDMFGWRRVFFLLAAMLAVAALALIWELVRNPLTRPPRRERTGPSFLGAYAVVLANPWARFIIGAVAVEATFMWGTFAYVGADLHLRFGLSFTLVGACVAAFAVGGLIYTASVRQLVNRLGQSGLALTGGLILGATYLLLALGLAWWIAPFAILGIGLGFYMLHNTLQTIATQMTPEVRGTAVSIFSSAIYLSQTVGVAAAAPVIDRYGAAPVFLIAALALAALGYVFARALRRHQSEQS